MANAKYDGKYLRCDIAFVRDAQVGGRLYSAQINEEVANGVFGYMGATLANKPEVKAFALPTADDIKSNKELYIFLKLCSRLEDKHSLFFQFYFHHQNNSWKHK